MRLIHLNHYICLGVCLATFSARAADNDLPDPMTCGKEFKEPITFKQASRSPFSGHKQKALTIQFSKPGAFTYSTSGMGVKQRTIDGTKLIESRKTGLLQKLAFSFDKEQSCSKKSNVDGCGLSVQSTLERLDEAEAAGVSGLSPAERKAQAAALACAKSISYSFMMKAFEIAASKSKLEPNESFNLNRLNSDEKFIVYSNLAVIKAMRDARESNSYTHVNRILSSVGSPAVAGPAK
ncbi:MAG TPA: hypothetical protein DCS07_14030 [Bdellovibrionales bacterium]|nr:MAG: hypothetical protein A2Z97_08280 [Bdellovibrionales bacterium GWB1_52_6]OFZ03000.1 MAG: hypothetical protein A2X97_12125 [Bdellovibrionales bacterium GWA1_52_35]OFZ41027.1 MAG: hypothetical protein A2070_03685 [Bdellovibrionales bacterium GWC1_52_8]HAR43729.1 hypothetical protein [Bdellovibrionales bacterium]HCM38807.1 hypothetical protein [Bdellovibrionales bacterium]